MVQLRNPDTVPVIVNLPAAEVPEHARLMVVATTGHDAATGVRPVTARRRFVAGSLTIRGGKTAEVSREVFRSSEVQRLLARRDPPRLVEIAESEAPAIQAPAAAPTPRGDDVEKKAFRPTKKET